jgi:multiple sugar transport system substrate-binding protein
MSDQLPIPPSLDLTPPIQDQPQTNPSPPASPSPIPTPPPPVGPAPTIVSSEKEDPLPPPETEPPMPPGYNAPQPAQAPEIKSSPFKIIIPIIIGLIVVGGIAFAVFKLLSNKTDTKTTSNTTAPQITTITYWGLWETETIMDGVIKAFEAENPTIKINYSMQSHRDYQDRLITELNGQSPPDIVRLHSTWLPLVYQNLLPASADTISATELETNFYPVINQIVLNNQVYGIPFSIEGLALYINTDMFIAAGIDEPKTWEDLKTAAKTLTVKDEATGKITRAGVALGNTINVQYWEDIVSLMLLQGGATLLNPTSSSVLPTLQYYTSFQNTATVWDSTMPPSVQAFANEKVAMIIAPSYVAIDIQTINPNLTWKTISTPQLPEVDPINWASFWFEAVPKNAKNKEAAWKFLKFLSSAKAQQTIYESASRERGFSQAPAHKSVAPLAQQNPIIASFIESLPTAKTFYTAGLTHDSDTALNSRLIKYLEDAINTTGQGSSSDSEKAMQALISGFNQVLSQYRLVTATPQNPIQ